MSRKRVQKREYAWQMDFFGGMDPSIVANRVYDLEAKLGRYPTEDDLIKDAEIASSPFSELLTVHEDEAKHYWKRRRIKNIFSNLRIARNGKPTETRAFYYVQPGTKAEGKKFIPAALALRSHPMHNQIVEVAYRYYRRGLIRFGKDRRMKKFHPLIHELQDKLELELKKLVTAQVKEGIGG